MGVWVCESSKLCRDHVGAGIIGEDLERGGGVTVVVVVDKDLVAEQEGLHSRYRYWDSIEMDCGCCDNTV
jgi:hypothetical protein